MSPSAGAPAARRPAARPDRVLAALLAAVLAAWIVVARTMGGMDGGPGTPLGPFGAFVASWVLMLAAMMLPAELRFTLVYLRLLRDDGAAAVGARAAVFLGGYLCVWTGFGALAWALDAALRGSAPAALAWTAYGPAAAGAVVVGAGLFQFSPWKRACLTHCVSPLGFFTRHWYQGLAGAVRLGLTHGLYCLGCCWALMAVMFAVGVMSLFWMSLLGMAMFIEKLAPPGWRFASVLGALLVALGLFIAIAPASVPGLVEPGAAVHHVH